MQGNEMMTIARPELSKTQFENTTGPRFAKRDFRNKFLES